MAFTAVTAIGAVLVSIGEADLASSYSLGELLVTWLVTVAALLALYVLATRGTQHGSPT